MWGRYFNGGKDGGKVGGGDLARYVTMLLAVPAHREREGRKDYWMMIQEKVKVA